MKWITILAIAISFTAGGAALAAEPERTMQGVQVSEAQSPDVSAPTNLYNQTFAMGPQLGFVTYTDNQGDKSTRGTVGVGLEWNLAPLFESAENGWAYPADYYLGVQTGAYLSRVGGGNADFFGGSSSGSGFEDATLITIPLNAKIGYNFMENARASIHGGGNLFYRSSAGAVRLGENGPVGDSAAWNVYPNVGADLEVQVSEPLSILARPDLTITSGENLFVGTLAANFLF